MARFPPTTGRRVRVRTTWNPRFADGLEVLAAHDRHVAAQQTQQPTQPTDNIIHTSEEEEDPIQTSEHESGPPPTDFALPRQKRRRLRMNASWRDFKPRLIRLRAERRRLVDLRRQQQVPQVAARLTEWICDVDRQLNEDTPGESTTDTGDASSDEIEDDESTDPDWEAVEEASR